MTRLFVAIVVVLGLSPCVATAKTLCIQLDTTGDVLVLRGLGKGVKNIAAYIAEYDGGSSFSVRPMSGGALLSSDGFLAGGFTDYGVGRNSFQDIIMIHRVQCSPGTDGKLGVLDFCSDIAIRYPDDTQTFSPGHVIDCIPEVATP